MKHVFIIDPKVFRDQQWRMDGLLDIIGQYFRTQDRPNFSTLFSHFPRDSIGLIQKQVDEAEPFETVRVYTIGGDSILFDCLNGVTGLPSMELAIAPYGAVNSFIRAFGEKKAELFKDIPALVEADTISTDVIKVGNNCAINGCAVGRTPATAMKKKELQEKLGVGLGRFAVGLLFILYRITSLFNKEIIAPHYDIAVDDEDYSGNYSLINIVNAPFFNRNKAPLKGAMPDDGLLDVMLFKAVSPLATSASLRKYLRGKIPSNCIRLQAKKVELKSEKPMWIQTDSEYLLDTSITFEVLPGAVQVVAVNNLVYQGF
jgi:diacylglycerol kinase family enzyme